MWTVKNFFSKIVSSLFPPHCYVCKKEGETICNECLRKFPKAIETPAPYITSVFSFKYKEIKNIIHAIKYYHRKDLIPPLAAAVSSELIRSSDSLLSSLHYQLVPVPMPKLRKYMRGYNQAEIIAGVLSTNLSIPVLKNILIRSRTPTRQVKSSHRADRLKNQHNSFKVAGNVTGLNIILVDDVTTTGATLSEARNVLIKAGAKSVKAVTIAH